MLFIFNFNSFNFNTFNFNLFNFITFNFNTFNFNTFNFKISFVFDVCFVRPGDFIDKPVDVSIDMMMNF